MENNLENILDSMKFIDYSDTNWTSYYKYYNEFTFHITKHNRNECFDGLWSLLVMEDEHEVHLGTYNDKDMIQFIIKFDELFKK